MSKDFLVEISARHIHISKEHLEVLFGNDYELSFRKELSQPGQYLTNDKVTLVTDKKSMDLSILGPIRKDTQVEISLTEARALGISAPIRESGDIKGSTGILLKGPKGEVTISEGVIIAKRHIHMLPSDAREFNVSNGDIVNVKLIGNGRDLVFGDTVVRVRDDFALAMHIDTDEANAAGMKKSCLGSIVIL